MFQVTRKADYGLLLIAALATHYSEGYVSLREVAQRRRLPYRFLCKIIIPLRTAGLVQSHEGATGGYRLARSPEKIYLREVLEALGENLFLVRCLDSDKACQSFCQCNARDFWHELQGKINEVVSKYTVADLLEKADFGKQPNVTFQRLIASF